MTEHVHQRPKANRRALSVSRPNPLEADQGRKAEQLASPRKDQMCQSSAEEDRPSSSTAASASRGWSELAESWAVSGMSVSDRREIRKRPFGERPKFMHRLSFLIHYRSNSRRASAMRAASPSGITPLYPSANCSSE